MRVTRTIDATEEEIEEAKTSAVNLVEQKSESSSLMDLFYTENLDELECGIKNLNHFVSGAWLLSSILLYTLIFDHELYRQSGLDWFHYSMESRERLGMDNHDITEMLGAARFFIKNHKALEQKGFKVEGNRGKLARAELAEKLCGNTEEVIDHIVSDTKREFKEWYQSFKKKKLPAKPDSRRDDIRVESGRFIIGDEDAVTVSEKISESDRERLNGYIKAIFETLRDGYEPAIVAVYDKKEAAVLPKLHDRHRRGK